MGACLSTAAAGQPALGTGSMADPALVPVISSSIKPSPLSRMRSNAGMRASSVIHRVKNVLSLLSDVSVSGYTVDCERACEVLHEHLHEGDTVSLYAYKCGSPSVCVLAGAAGVGAHVLQQQLITAGSSWSASLCCMQTGTSYLYRTVNTADDLKMLPQDWAELYKQEGLKTFLAMHITVAGQDTPIGVLTLASRAPGAFMDNSWGLQLGMIGTGLVPLLTTPWLHGVSDLSSHLQEGCSSSSTFTAFAATFLQGSAQLLQSTTHMQLGVRLGLLSEDQQEVLLLHYSGSSTGGSSNSFGHQQLQSMNSKGSSEFRMSIDCNVSVFANAQEFGKYSSILQEDIDIQPMEVARLPADQTLLLQAVKASNPQFVADVAAYLEHDGDLEEYPCADLVDLGDEHLASIIVLPILGSNSKVVGGLYVTHQQAGGFLQDNLAVQELAALLQRVLQQDGLVKVPEQWDEFQVSPASSESSFVMSGPVTPTASLPVPTASNRLALMHRVWQREDKQQDVCESDQYLKELEVHSILGQGGFSTVYSGTWHGSRTAIKVMPTANTDKMGINMKAAMEMAALSTLRHPNIVRTYACLTEMVEERTPRRRRSSDPTKVPAMDVHFRKATHEDEAAGKSNYNILVMEQCDRGCLWTAIRHQQLLHKKLPDGRSKINMRLLYSILLEIANSLKYLHSVGMVHCDLKADNIIMASTSGNSHGFMCKLADFGLVRLVGDKGLVKNTDTSGTLTHLAPERFQAGSMISTAVDVFSFGVMMYELYAGQKPYYGMQPGPALAKSIMHGMRPQFPGSTPTAFKQLAEQCWAANPAERPTMEAVLCKLQEQLAAASRPSK